MESPMNVTPQASQTSPPFETSIEPQQEVPPDLSHKDPWRKSNLLTLDGGGIRGYASLWVVKHLMDEIAKIERAHSEPHTSSFEPKAQRGSIPNGLSQRSPTAGSEQLEVPSRAHTDSSMSSGLGRGLLRRSTRPQPTGNTRQVSDPQYHEEELKGFLPCHYFDYIGGTSTGGLNAIMLGRLRMSVEDCIEQYPEIAESVFTGKKRYLMTRIITGSGTKYSHEQLEAVIKKIVARRIRSGERPRQSDYEFERFHSPPDLCKTVVVANEDNGPAHTPYLFRTYDHENGSEAVKNPGPAHKHQIWQVARATSAAPNYFDPIEIDNKLYFDGGLGNNNPVMLLLEEVASKAEVAKYNEAVSIVVSVGTGLKPTRREKVKHKFPRLSNLPPIRKGLNLISKLKNEATKAEKAHIEAKTLFTQIGFQHYYRWDGGEEVGGLDLDEWHPVASNNRRPTPEFIKQAVKTCMEKDGPQQELQACAARLVQLRRHRLAHEPTHGIFRRRTFCTLLRCLWCDEMLWDRRLLKEHLCQEHSEKLAGNNLESLVRGVEERPPVFPGGPL